MLNFKRLPSKPCNMIKKLASITFLFTLLNTGVIFATESSGLTWYTNLDTVVTLSNESDKPIFGFFTGSDWCGWCMKLQREVFAKQDFIDWAQKNVILLELDFPRKTVQTDELKTQNRNLQQAFQVSGYPTIWIFTAVKDAVSQNFSLTAWGKLGYPAGAETGKEEVKFLAEANKILDNNRTKTN